MLQKIEDTKPDDYDAIPDEVQNAFNKAQIYKKEKEATQDSIQDGYKSMTITAPIPTPQLKDF